MDAYIEPLGMWRSYNALTSFVAICTDDLRIFVKHFYCLVYCISFQFDLNMGGCLAAPASEL
jgi:hypothetical protein